MSTRVEGAMPPLIRVQATASLGVGAVGFIITVKDLGDDFWSYNLSEAVDGVRNSRLAFGRLSATDHLAALRQAAAILATGYPAGTVERGLLEEFAHSEA